MNENPNWNNAWESWAQLQRGLCEVWAKSLGPANPVGQWSPNPLEIGANLLRGCLKLQGDTVGAMTGSHSAGPELPKLVSQYLEALWRANDGWLELQRRASRLWFESMGQIDPSRYLGTDALMKAAQEWMRACESLTERTLQDQAELMLAAAPAPSQSKPQLRKERQRVAAAAIG